MPYPRKAAKPASVARLGKSLSIWGLGDGKFGARLPKQTPFRDRDVLFYEKRAVLTEPETLSVGRAQPPDPPRAPAGRGSPPAAKQQVPVGCSGANSGHADNFFG